MCDVALFACTAWGHNFGVRLALHVADGSATGRMDVIFRTMLGWNIAAPQHMYDSALYILIAQIPLRGHIVK